MSPEGIAKSHGESFPCLGLIPNQRRDGIYSASCFPSVEVRDFSKIAEWYVCRGHLFTLEVFILTGTVFNYFSNHN
jgi:hypothetical protein